MSSRPPCRDGSASGRSPWCRWRSTSSPVAAVTLIPARAALGWVYAGVRQRLTGSDPLTRRLAAELGPIPWHAALVGALVGGVSHVLLEAVIHPDVRPWAPWSNANGLFVPGLFGLMHPLCAFAAVVGMLLWLDKTRDGSL